jgi:hypothetical protein
MAPDPDHRLDRHLSAAACWARQLADREDRGIVATATWAANGCLATTSLTSCWRNDRQPTVPGDRSGTAYLTEDADSPFGHVYRFQPDRPGRGGASLRACGRISALSIPDLAGTDLSPVTEPGTVFRHLEWVPIDQPDPAEGETLRTLYPATPIQKAEGAWFGDGAIRFVSSRGGGPDAEDVEDRSAAAHGGQIQRYQPQRDRLDRSCASSRAMRSRAPTSSPCRPTATR